MEAGLRILPDQWSSLLYGDLDHKSHMQSIIDKVCSWLILSLWLLESSILQCLFSNLSILVCATLLQSKVSWWRMVLSWGECFRCRLYVGFTAFFSEQLDSYGCIFNFLIYAKKNFFWLRPVYLLLSLCILAPISSVIFSKHPGISHCTSKVRWPWWFVSDAQAVWISISDWCFTRFVSFSRHELYIIEKHNWCWSWYLSFVLICVTL